MPNQAEALILFKMLSDNGLDLVISLSIKDKITKQAPLKHRALIVFLACLRHMDNNRRVDINVYDLAELLNIDPSNLRTELRILSDLGLIERRKRRGDVMRYYIPPEIAFRGPVAQWRSELNKAPGRRKYDSAIVRGKRKYTRRKKAEAESQVESIEQFVSASED